MTALIAYSSFLLTVALTLTRPRIGSRFHFGPLLAAILGVLLMMSGGVIARPEFAYAARMLWRPLLTIASIMVMTAAAESVGILRWVADRIAGARPRHASHAFTYVFFGSALTATVLNNDSAVILLTPLTVRLVLNLYPRQPELVEPFAFAVFLAPGVAPFITSNPMNMIVASFAGLDFNRYALRMLPVSLASILVTYLVLKAYYARELGAAPVPEAVAERSGLSLPARVIAAVLVLVLVAYPVASYLGWEIWTVAFGAALLCSVVALAAGVSPGRLRRGVPVQILGLLAGLFLIALGMRNAGAIGQLAAWYHSFIHTGYRLSAVGATSLIGSALMNNHPMALLNMLALQSGGSSNPQTFLAALIGGDLGPRLLPIGSLAGLLWVEGLGRQEVHIPLHKFVRLGVLTCVPAFVISILVLSVSH